MSNEQSLSADELNRFKIAVFDPFSEFLGGTNEERSFEISLLDVVRFSGHACPSMVGAFLVAQRAIRELYPESSVCIRGDIEIDMPCAATQGATGPIANVFGFITGAWAESGFGGLNGQFRRRGLLRFDSPNAPRGGYRFTRLTDGSSIDVFYDPKRVEAVVDPQASFQKQWRQRIKAVLTAPDLAVTCELPPSELNRTASAAVSDRSTAARSEA